MTDGIIPQTRLDGECPRCAGTGTLTRTLRLVTGRGANLYRHGGYARSVTVTGPRPGDPCPSCAGSGYVVRVCGHCGAHNLPPYEADGCALCGRPWAPA